MLDEFVAGSVIVCQQCYHPIYALDRGLGPMDRGGRGASAFRPLKQADLAWLLASRPDIPTWWQDKVRDWLHSPESYRTLNASRPKAGDETICPNCGGHWTRFVPREEGAAEHERAYVHMLLDIPPNQARHRQVLKWVANEPENPPEITYEERH